MRTKAKTTKWAEYEKAKRELLARMLSAKDYETELRRIAARLGV